MYELPATDSGNGPKLSIAKSAIGALTDIGHNLALAFEAGFFHLEQLAQVLHHFCNAPASKTVP